MLVSFEEFNSNFNSIHGVRVTGGDIGVRSHNVYLDEMLASSTFHP
jgi:hypothetical protein